MTNLEALQSLIEYKVPNLLEKVMIDHSLSTTETYTVDNQKDLDLCLRDVCLYLISHPDYSEGGLSLKFNPGKLNATAKRIELKYNLSHTLSGEKIW